MATWSRRGTVKRALEDSRCLRDKQIMYCDYNAHMLVAVESINMVCCEVVGFRALSSFSSSWVPLLSPLCSPSSRSSSQFHNIDPLTSFPELSQFNEIGYFTDISLMTRNWSSTETLSQRRRCEVVQWGETRVQRSFLSLQIMILMWLNLPVSIDSHD